MKNDNRGLSLVEIIIVITIMSVLTAVGIIGFGMISGKPAEQCAENIKVSLLNNRTTALGKFKSDVVITDSGSGIQLTENIANNDGTSSSKTQKIGDSDVLVEYSTDASTYTPLSSLTISFDRATGAIKHPGGDTDLYIKCSRAGKSYVVQVYHLTGKVVILD